MGSWETEMLRGRIKVFCSYRSCFSEVIRYSEGSQPTLGSMGCTLTRAWLWSNTVKGGGTMFFQIFSTDQFPMLMLLTLDPIKTLGIRKCLVEFHRSFEVSWLACWKFHILLKHVNGEYPELSLGSNHWKIVGSKENRAQILRQNHDFSPLVIRWFIKHSLN